MEDALTKKLRLRYEKQVEEAVLDFLTDPVYTINIAKAAVVCKQRKSHKSKK